jgi:very-short-patch-repair endonuclease
MNYKKQYNPRPTNDKVVCILCGFEASKEISTHLRYAHKLKPKEYCKINGLNKYFYMSLNFQQERSQRLSGKNNPGFNHGGKLSSLSKNFIHYNQDSIEKTANKIKQAKKSNPQNDITQIEYYLSRGMNKEEAQQTLLKRQSTFSLDKCIKKYGEQEGKKRWEARQEKWIKNFKKQNWSKISQILFNDIMKFYKGNVYYATYERKDMVDYQNKEYRFKSITGKMLLPDFIDIDIKKIIEFDGDYWHGEKKGNQQRDKIKEDNFIESGYKVLRIQEREYNNDKTGTLQKCLDFLKI